MNEHDLEKMVSIFLSELDTLSESLVSQNRTLCLPSPAEVAQNRAQGPPDHPQPAVKTQTIPTPAKRMPVRNIDILLMNNPRVGLSERWGSQAAPAQSIPDPVAHPSGPPDDKAQMAGWALFRSRCASVMPSFKISIVRTKRLK
jgi:hypothetical protein